MNRLDRQLVNLRKKMEANTVRLYQALYKCQRTHMTDEEIDRAAYKRATGRDKEEFLTKF